jgi:ADP-heptose:LPS heptosyltransferase
VPPVVSYLLIFAGVLLVLRALLRLAFDGLLARENQFLIHMHKGGLGDAFCQTGLIRALGAKHPGMKFIVLTKYPDFYLNLPEVVTVVDLRPFPWLRVKMLHWGLRALRLRRAHDFVYKPQKQTPKAKLDANPAWRPHLVELASAKLRLAADFSDVRGHFRAYSAERKTFEAKYAELGDFAIVVPAGKTSYTPNKEWGFDNYAKVVAATPGVKWVQLGVSENTLLDGVVDLRGKTGLREMAWLISKAKFVLCGEGLHNHIAGATGTPCFVVFSGFHYWEIAKYPATVPILAPVAPPCAPCFLKTTCPVPGKPCTNDITPDTVVKAISAKLG